MSDQGFVDVTLPVQWGDMDALGHVNNARYLTWFESARIALFDRIGVVSRGPLTVGPILATTTCDFVKPVVYPCTVRVRVRVSRVGETSITMEYIVLDAASDAVCARGSSVAVLFDYRTSAKVRVPDDVRRAIDALASRS